MPRALVDYAVLWNQAAQPPDLAAFVRGQPGLARTELMDLLRLDLTERWHRRLGSSLDTALALLAEHGVDQPHLAVELIHVEMQLRQQAGETPTLEEYEERFPDLAATIREQVTAAATPLPATYETVSLPPPAAMPPLSTQWQPSLAVEPEILGDDWPELEGYVIEKELGRGGMGVVYQARDKRLGRRVALKMILGGALARPGARLRFLFEAEIVARLRHPNIVAIYEIGGQRAQPYFALEFVEGGSLAQVLAGQQVPPREAAQLVERLARAIPSAHAQGIIHRDIKPANVLLAQSPAAATKPEASPSQSSGSPTVRLDELVPKITDFGLAKLMTSESGLTATGAVIGTPSYMAPEQAGGRPHEVGPATDVYSLGAMLYEMLAGRPPYREKTGVETVMKIMESDPPPLASLRSKLPRDLITIVERCLQRDPGARYPLAGELADELARFRHGEPIRARRVGRGERLIKWARRRPAAAALVAVSLLALVSITAVSLLYARALSDALAEAQSQNLRADENLTALGAAVDDFTDLLEADPRLESVDLGPLRAKLLEKAIPFYERLTSQRRGDRKLEAARGLAFGRLATLRTTLGDLERALGDAEDMGLVFADLVQVEPTSTHHRRNLTLSLISQGSLLRRLGRSDQALPVFAAAQEQADLLSKQEATNPRLAVLHLKIANNSGQNLRALGRFEEALARFEQGRQLGDRLVRELPEDEEIRADLATLCQSQGSLLDDLNRPREALAVLRHALVLRQDLLRREPLDAARRSQTAAVHNKVGLHLASQGDITNARDHYAMAIRLLEKLAADLPSRPDLRSDWANVLNNLALLEVSARRPEAAQAALLRAIGLYENLVAEYPRVQSYRLMLSRQLVNASTVIPGPPAAGLARVTQAERVLAPLVTSARMDPEVRNQLAVCARARASLYSDLRDWEAALAAYRESVEQLRSLAQDYPQIAEFQLDLAATLCNLGHCCRDQELYDEALAEYARAVAVLEPLVAENPQSQRGRDYLRNTRWGQAEVLGLKGEHIQAAEFWQKTLDLDNGSERFRLRVAQAEAWARGGAVDPVLAAVADMLTIPNLTQRALIRQARIAALAASHLDASDPRRTDLEELALAALTRARDRGAIAPGSLEPRTDFAVFRTREELRAFLDQSAPKSQAAPATPAPMPLADQARQRLERAERMLKQDPRSAQAYFLRAEGHALNNHLQAAIADADRALELLPPGAAERGPIQLARSAWQFALDAQERLGLKPR